MDGTVAGPRPGDRWPATFLEGDLLTFADEFFVSLATLRSLLKRLLKTGIGFLKEGIRILESFDWMEAAESSLFEAIFGSLNDPPEG